VSSESKNIFPMNSSVKSTISGVLLLAVLVLPAILLLGCGNDKEEPDSIKHGIPKTVDFGSLYVKTEPDGAEIFIDGQSMGNAPLILKRIVTGPHTLIARKKGHRDAEEKFVIAKDLVVKKNLQLIYDPNYTPASIPGATSSEAAAASVASAGPEEPAKHRIPTVTQFGSLFINTDPAKGEVMLDGKSLGIAPVEVKEVLIGSYTLSARKKYYQENKLDVVIEKDKVLKKTIKLMRGKGNITVFTTPDQAQVYLNGKKQPDTTPMTITDILAGKHKLIFKKDVYNTSGEHEIDVFPGQTASLETTLEKYGRLYVNTNQDKAVIDLPAIKQDYKHGMLLAPGEYKVTATVPKLQTIKKTAVISGGKDSKLDIKFALSLGSLYVTTQPAGATIRLMNSKDKFKQGMELAAGKYQIRVEKSGYTATSKWVTVAANQKSKVTVTLNSPGGLNNSLGMKFKWIKPGTFMMGSPSTEEGRDIDEYLHKVTLTKGFYMQTTEVTQGQWRKVMGSNPSHFDRCGDNCPVENVSWIDVQKFMTKLKNKDGKNYALPTEAEWEYACRAGSKKAIYTGNLQITGLNSGPQLDPIAWYGGNSCASYRGATECSEWSGTQYKCQHCGVQPVARKKPNAWGLYDMLGNVWEWTSDWYNNIPDDASYVTNPKGPPAGTHRIIRGGSWFSGAAHCRSAFHDRSKPNVPSNGVRVRLIIRGPK